MSISWEAKLLAIDGPLRGRTFECTTEDLTIGRAPDCAVVIDHRSVSRQHCVLRPGAKGFTASDLGSRNGTMVNDEPVQETTLKHGDRITVGIATFMFLSDEADVASLLSDVRIAEDSFDPSSAVQLRASDTVYLNPDAVLSGADPNIVGNFRALLRLGATLQSSDTLAGLEEQALQLIIEAIPADSAAILLTGSRADQFLSLYGRRRDGSEHVSVSRSVIAHVLTNRAAILTNDAPRVMPSQSLIESHAQSLMCVPLLSSSRALGVIYLASVGQSRFEPSHLELLTAMAAMLALPLESTRRLEWLENENRRLRADIDDGSRLIGESDAMKQVHDFIARVARSDSTLLIRGESGTGKELIAHAIHRSSRRSKGPLVAINCAALRSELLESELFGYEKGAFTSAIATRKGKLEIADGGTLFLDEVGELNPDLQAKLLRVLQEREFERVGGTRAIKVDVRIIAATNRNLEHAMREGRFREDLYYRLNVVSMEAPPLRRRGQDAVELARYFAARYALRYNSRIRGIAADAEKCIADYEWPGNVRELQNAIERAIVLGSSEMISPDDLPETILEATTPKAAPPVFFHDVVRETKRRTIHNALQQTGGNHAEAARVLGVNRTYLHRLIRSLGVEEP